MVPNILVTTPGQEPDGDKAVEEARSTGYNRRLLYNLPTDGAKTSGSSTEQRQAQDTHTHRAGRGQ